MFFLLKILLKADSLLLVLLEYHVCSWYMIAACVCSGNE